MISVASLLNPALEEAHPFPSPQTSTRDTPEFSSPSSPPPTKKQKMAKDAAIFTKSGPRGEVRYKPFEKYDSKTMAELEKFSIMPLGRIGEYHRHIPYNSDKRGFLEKTGLFQYTFQLPGEERKYNVLWDYNIGIVRITPFFKCCQYAKTVPAKMLNGNPGLRDICHSITGGALAAQGYWMPFDAAKAIAATFCYGIRYALLPLFGPSFVHMCAKPGTEGFGQMVIDPDVIARCTQQAKYYSELAAADRLDDSRSSTPESKPAAIGLMSRKMKPKAKRAYNDTPYTSDADGSANYLPSPQSSVNLKSPRVPKPWPGTLELPFAQEIYADTSAVRHERPTSPTSSSSGGDISPKTTTRVSKRTRKTGKAVEQESSSQRPMKESASPHTRSPSPNTATKETRAAYVLMQLHLAGPSLQDAEHSLKRRARS